MFQADNIQAPTPDELIDTPAEVAPVFLIDTEEKACWLLRKLANLDAEKARVKAQYDALTKQIDSDRNGLMARFGSDLEAWTRQEITRRGGKRKSIVTLQGTLCVRAQPARFVVEDETTFALWAKDNAPDVVNTLYKLRPEAKDFASAQFEATGELLPGTNRTEASDKFSIQFKGEVKNDGEGT